MLKLNQLGITKIRLYFDKNFVKHVQTSYRLNDLYLLRHGIFQLILDKIYYFSRVRNNCGKTCAHSQELLIIHRPLAV